MISAHRFFKEFVMLGQPLLHAALAVSTGVLLGINSASAQEIPEPVPSTPNPGGSVLAPDEADGVPDNDASEIIRPDRPEDRGDVVPARGNPRTGPPARQTTPMTAEDLQTWQQIATLHEQFVRSQVRGAADAQDISRTDPNRQRLQQLWERLAHIERQLIVTGAYDEAPAAISATTRPAERAWPRRDLDEIPDPLTASNQRVPASENDRDRATARALAQEDRSPPPDPIIRRDTLREAAQRDPLTARAVEDAIERVEADEVVAPAPADIGSLWQEFIEVRRQILIAEIAAARGLAEEE
jgi:hypothetical protein